MSSVGDIGTREDRPPFVRFERVAVEDPAASLREGRYIARDVDFVFVTAPYSKDIYKQKAQAWFGKKRIEAGDGRFNPDWLDRFESNYEKWKAGQEIPLHGVPIKGWGVISPAQQEMLLKINVLTVEDLAGINDEGVRRIGMGAIDLKTKARGWLAQLRDKGPLTQEISQLKNENELLKKNIETLTERVQMMGARLDARTTEDMGGGPVYSEVQRGIGAVDILDDAENQDPVPAKSKRGRPRKDAVLSDATIDDPVYPDSEI
jgi:hypothetical protein